MNLAQLVVIGNVATNPELIHLPDGRSRTRFRVAATSRVMDTHTGRWKDGDTTFLAVVAWRGLAELADRLTCGDRVVVIGQLRQYDFARDGARETGYELQAQEIALGLTAGRPTPDRSTPSSAGRTSTTSAAGSPR